MAHGIAEVTIAQAAFRSYSTRAVICTGRFHDIALLPGGLDADLGEWQAGTTACDLISLSRLRSTFCSVDETGSWSDTGGSSLALWMGRGLGYFAPASSPDCFSLAMILSATCRATALSSSSGTSSIEKTSLYLLCNGSASN